MEEVAADKQQQKEQEMENHFFECFPCGQGYMTCVHLYLYYKKKTSATLYKKIFMCMYSMSCVHVLHILGPLYVNNF